MIINHNIPISNDSPIYSISITPAYEGFVVVVEEMMPPISSMNIDQFKAKMSEISAAMPNGEESEIQQIIRKNNIEEPPKINIVGNHVFFDFNEMTAFISLIYEPNIKMLNNIRDSYNRQNKHNKGKNL